MLAYHEISANTRRDVYGISVETFRRHARIVKESGNAGECVSFDDGHISNAELAKPVLDEFQIPAIFFITTSWVGTRKGAMTWSDVQMLDSAGYTIASHSHTHPLLTACDDTSLYIELSVSKSILEDRLGKEVKSISMPGGRLDARILKACRKVGYSCVYTSQVGELRSAENGMLNVIGRYMVTRATDDATLTSYLTRKWGTLARLQAEANAKRVVKTLVGDRFYQKAWRWAVRSQPFEI